MSTAAASPSRILIVAPHADDELFGAGASLLRWRDAGAEIHMVLVACSDVRMRHTGGVVTATTRAAEFTASAEAVSTTPPTILWMHDTRLDEQPLSALVSRLDDVLDRFRPDLMLIPEPSYHQDHQYVNRACVAALRPTGGARPNKVLAYEVPTSTGIGSPAFLPNMYVNVTGELERKADLLRRIYVSQYTAIERGGLAEHGMRRHAAYRGAECGVEFAEAFVVLRELLP
jgi:LmbE family N-acetylglucosaminyl deacetylase